MRRPAAAIAAAALLLEAVGLTLLNFYLGAVVDRQQMSLAGLDPGVMSGSTRGAGVALGLYLLLCGLMALRTAVRGGPPPGHFARVLLISCAVLHAVLGALSVGLVGWAAFALLMVVFGLLVLTLVGEEAEEAEEAGAAAPAARAA